MNRSRSLPVIFLGLAHVLAACGGATATPTSEPFDETSPTVSVAPSEAASEPVNADAAAHTVTEGVDGVAAEDPIIDEELSQSGSTSFTFDELGTYDITCLFHPSMNMSIVVE